MNWVLDSSFLIDLDGADPRAVRAIERMFAQDDQILVPAQAAMEVLAGADSGSILVTLAHLRDSFQIVVTDHSQILEGGRLARLARERGLRPRWADIQIGAVAMLNAANVVTANPKDFLALDIPAWNHRDGDAMPAAA